MGHPTETKSCWIMLSVVWLYGCSMALAEGENSSDLERSLITALQSDAPKADKALICKRLAVHGSKHSVEALQPWLADPELASWARIALEAIPDRAAGKALQETLPNVKGRLRVGIIHSIAVRRDTDATNILARVLEDDDAQAAAAAAVALGKIGGPTATKVLEQTLETTSADRRSAVAEGCILCAEQLLRLEANELATNLYDKVRQADVPQQRIIEATRGAILARGDTGIPLLVEQLQSSDQLMFYLGLQITREMPGVLVTNALVRQLDHANARRQLRLVYALADRRDEAVQPAVLHMAAKQDIETEVRLAAVKAIGQVGDADCVETLVDIASDGGEPFLDPVQTALHELSGADVDRRIVERLGTTTGTARLVLVKAIGARRIEAIPELLTAADDANVDIRQAALHALGQTVGPNDLPALIKRVTAINSKKLSKDRDVAQAALHAAAVRMPHADDCVNQLVSAMSTASVPAQNVFLEIIGNVGGTSALQALSDSATGKEPILQDTASRLLGQWMTSDAAPVLLQLAKSDVSGKFRTRGLRGYLRIVRQFPFQDTERVMMCRRALQAAERDAERELVLQILARYPCLESLQLAAEITDIESLRQTSSHVCLVIAHKTGTDSEPVRKLLDQVGFPPVQLEIVKAEYGADDKVVDVTAVLTECAGNIRLLTLPEKKKKGYNAVFGDPAPNVVKVLTVHYRVDGELGKATFAENEPIILPLP